MLGYINSEIHKSYSPLFNKATVEATANERREYLKKRYAYIEGILSTQQYLVDNKFSAADAYLYTVTRWAPFVNVDLTGFPNLKEFQARVEARPAVQQALKEEGLLK
jgi:glutathione S-transferase